MNFSVIILAIAASFFSQTAWSYEEESQFGYIDSNVTVSAQPPSFSKHLNFAPPGDRLRKFNLALDTLQVPREPAPSFSDFPETSTISFDEVQARLPFIDPDKGLSRYLSFDRSPAVSLYQDFWSTLLPQNLFEYSLGLKAESGSEDSNDLIYHLETIAAQAKIPGNPTPLTGLKVVIDPGHMGTPDWDVATGKYVEIKGVRVSEGQLNLWTSLLVANELEALGATVILTRTQDGPVSSENYQSFDVSPYLNQTLYNSLDDWMSTYLTRDDATLARTIKNTPEIKKLYSSDQRLQFFIGGADLEARSLIADREKPDVLIDIHFDADKLDQLQNRVNNLEAFVPGAFRGSETGSRLNRSFALKHLLEVRRWNESVDLATEITSRMAQNLGIGLEDSSTFLTSVPIKNGVYARNLYITRRNLSSLMVFLECLHYDHVKEFPLMAKKDRTGNYHGATFQYPSRLNLIASGVRDGILAYFQK